MSGLSQLTNGCLKSIMSGEDVDKPILQLLGTKKISSNEGTERYRLLVSDGIYLNSFAMLATQLNNLINEANLVEFSIIRIDRYITSVVNKTDKGNKRVLVILELTVLKHGSEVKHKIGTPISYTEDGSKPSTTLSSVSEVQKPKNEISNGSSYKPNIESNSSFSNQNNNTMNKSVLNPTSTHPIAVLTPYQKGWVIKARVTAKSGIRTWSNARGEGKLFSLDLMDQSGEIRVTAFKEQCDRFYDMIEVDKVYYISKCQLKTANKQFSNIKNEYEMTFTPETIVQPCEEEKTGVPQVHYNLVPISQVANMEAKAMIDVIGICNHVGEVQVFTGKLNNKEFQKREVTLVDTSKAAIQLTLWGNEALNFNGDVESVILVKGAVVAEFNGEKNLTVGVSSTLKLNPDIPEAHKLRGWVITNGLPQHVNIQRSSFSTDWLTLHEVNTKQIGNGDKPAYFQTKAVIQNISSNSNLVYKACPQDGCNKKVIEEDPTQYRCEKCNAVFPNFQYRLLVNMEISDWTGVTWVTCFNDIAEQLLKKTAQEIGEAIERDAKEREELINPIIFRDYIFKLRTKFDVEMNKNKMSVMNAAPVNFKEYNKYLISNLKALTGIGNVKAGQ